MVNYYSPLRYPGGKNSLTSFVSKIFYDNGLMGIDYAEPYAGGAGLAMRLLYEGFVNTIHINDLDNSIYQFWCAILNRHKEFCEWIEDVEISIPMWNYYRDVQTHALEYDGYELAKSTFFLNRTNISGIIKGGVIGGQSQTGKYKIDARFNKSDLIERIHRIAAMRNKIFVYKDDAMTFLNKINRRKHDYFVFIDPPYYQKGYKLYMNFYSKNDHVKLSKRVLRLNKYWVLTYDQSPFITDLYKDKYNNIVSYSISQSASNRIGEELVIIPDKLSYRGSYSLLNGANLV